MLTISLMFWTDSACFLVHMLADPYVRQPKCPSIRLITWAFDVSAVYLRGRGPFLLDISFGSRNSHSQKRTGTTVFALPCIYAEVAGPA